MANYADLHNHTHFSIYDGSGSPLQHVLRAKELGYPAIAITDHGSVAGWMETYMYAQEHGIKPVLGVEAYFQPTFVPGEKDYHMTVYAMNQTGYKNLSKLMTVATQESYYRRHPIFTIEQIAKYNEGLIINTGCVGGYIPQLYKNKKYKLARMMARSFSELLGDRYYMEVMPWAVEDEGRDLQYEVNCFVIDMAHALGRKVVMTSDAHYLKPDHYQAYERMWQMQKGKGPMMTDYTHLYLHSADEMLQAWEEQMGFDGTTYLEESVKIADRCDVAINFKDMVPRQDWGMPAFNKLVNLCAEGLKARDCLSDEYIERIQNELRVIHHLGKEDYMLICWDAIDFARQQGIMVGPGRGSVCGSLVAYALGITNVDPIRFGTTFERFLHKEKIDVNPDIDSDFLRSRRPEVINYLFEKYPGRSAQIITFGYFKTKVLANELAKQYPEISLNLVAELKNILEEIEFDKEHHTKEQLINHATYGNFFQKLENNYSNFFFEFLQLSGQAKYQGVHPSGVAITPGPITDYVPLMKAKQRKTEEESSEEDDDGNDEYAIVTAFDMKSLDKAGILKLDILGLITLSIVDQIEKMVGCTFSYDLLDDPKIYQGFRDLDLFGVFQFGGNSMLRTVKKVQPTNFREVMACNAVVRPGCDLDGYVAGKKGNINKNSPIYKYTKETYGTVVYEEDKMAIALGLAGLSLTDTDKLIKQAKKGSISQEIQNKFIKGAMQKSGISERVAKDIVKELSKYAFNKGHAAGYTILACYTMWLKIYYPTEFFMTCLYWAAAKSSGATRKFKIEKFEGEAVKKNTFILPPHVNGTANYSIKKVGEAQCLQRGLISIAGIGAVSANKIVAERVKNGPYTSLEDFKKRVAPLKANIGKVAIQKLLDAGALEFNEGNYVERGGAITGGIKADIAFKQKYPDTSFYKSKKELVYAK
jgi:DNA polymerase-3 subunit alpha